MGTYHSYPGDAKLEDSKDNWYRISGLGLSNRNFITSEQENNAGDNYGFQLVSQGVSSTILFKAVNGFATRNQAFITKFPNTVIGREFLIKDRSNGINDILPFNGKLDSSGVQTLGKTLIKDNIHNEMFVLSMDNDRLRGTLPDQADLQTALRPMLTLKPVDPGITNPIILSCRINAKLIDRNYGPNNQRFGWDRTIKFDPLYSAYSIKQIELVLNVDTKGNSTGNGIGAAVVMAGIVPPKNDETICIEYRTQEAIESSNSYTLKITFNNNKVLYIQNALVTTGASPLAQDKTQTRIYRMSDLV